MKNFMISFFVGWMDAGAGEEKNKACGADLGAE
jgi:hypothetical protein